MDDGQGRIKIPWLVDRLGLTLVAGEKGVDHPVTDGYCGDLLSDVMGNAPPDSVWITIQSHQNIIAVALLREIAAVVITGGFEPDPETIAKADQEGIPVLTWPGSAYVLAGKLYALGIGSKIEDP